MTSCQRDVAHSVLLVLQGQHDTLNQLALRLEIDRQGDLAQCIREGMAHLSFAIDNVVTLLRKAAA